MKKKIKLIFHIGRGKTATTYLQSHLSKNKDILFIGKNIKKEFKGIVNTIHSQLFFSVRSEIDSGFPT